MELSKFEWRRVNYILFILLSRRNFINKGTIKNYQPLIFKHKIKTNYKNLTSNKETWFTINRNSLITFLNKIIPHSRIWFPILPRTSWYYSLNWNPKLLNNSLNFLFKLRCRSFASGNTFLNKKNKQFIDSSLQKHGYYTECSKNIHSTRIFK